MKDKVNARKIVFEERIKPINTWVPFEVSIDKAKFLIRDCLF